MTVGMVDEAASGQQAFQLHMNRLDITMIPIGDIHYIENRQCEDAVIVGSQDAPRTDTCLCCQLFQA